MSATTKSDSGNDTTSRLVLSLELMATQPQSYDQLVEATGFGRPFMQRWVTALRRKNLVVIAERRDPPGGMGNKVLAFKLDPGGTDAKHRMTTSSERSAAWKKRQLAVQHFGGVK